MKKLLTTLSFMVIGLLSMAQLITPFTTRYTVTQKGGIVILANTAAGCGTGTSSCASLNCVNSHAEMPPLGTAADNDFVQNYVDIDGNASTYMSSSDSMNLASCSQITFAGLYWGAGGPSTNGQTNGTHWTNRANVKLKVNNGAYQTLTADNAFNNTTGYLSYHNFKDITSIVSAAGIKGRFTVADMPLLYDASTTVKNRWGGWAIVIVYKNDLENYRNLSVFNGLTNVSNGITTDLTISGFYTPPTGPVTLGLGLLTYDGDRGFAATGTSACPSSYKGDSLLFRGAGVFRPVFDALHPINDVFNSSIAYNGVLTPYRNPSYNNTLGHDASQFVPNNITKTFIGNGASTATIRQKTGGETYLTQVVTFAVDVYEPDLRGSLSFVDLNGGTVVPGDTVEYTATIKNIGSDPSVNTYMIDTLPSAAVYVPGSIRVTAGPNMGVKTDVLNDDQGEYLAATRAVRVRIGTGANAVNGGVVINSPSGIDSTQVKFRATATTDCVVLLCDTHINNKFNVFATGQISSNTFNTGSNPGIFDAFGCPIPGSTITDIVAGVCPQPTASNNTPMCEGNTINLFASSSNVSTYSWTGPNGFTSTLQNPTIPNSTVAMAGTYTVAIHPNGSPCFLTATTNVVINPSPVMTNASAVSICTGATLNIPLTSNAGATYTWIGSDNPNVTGEITTLQTSSTITNTLFNPTLLPQTVTYTVTPTGTIAACPGVVQVITVTVNPLPDAIATPAVQTICSGGVTSIALSSTSPSTTYSWSVSQSGVSGGSVASGSNIAQTLTETGPSTGTATYTVTPTASTCVGTPTTVTINVTQLFIPTFTYNGSPFCQNGTNPAPVFSGGGTAGHFTSAPGLSINSNTGVINLASSTPGTYTVTNSFAAVGACAAQSATAQITITALPIAGFNYTATPYCQNLPNPSPTFFSGGLAGTFSSGSGLIFLSTSTGQVDLSASAVGTYTVTNTVAAANGCPAVNAEDTIVIQAVPTMTNTSTANICSGSPLNISLTSSIPSTYTWITSNNANTTGESTTLQTSGVINNTLVNTVNTPQTLTYTVTPVSTSGSCIGSTQSVVVTVNPQPMVTSPSSTTICSGSSINISLTSNMNATFTWLANDNANTTGESTTSQSTSTISDVIVNTTTVPQTLTYTVTPTSTVFGNCLGSNQNVSVIVNPTTTASAGGSASICSSGNFTLSGTIGGGATSAQWTTSGTGTFNNTSLLNATYTPSLADIAAGSVTLTITTDNPVGPCDLVSDFMVLTINSAATVSANSDATICAGSTYTLAGSFGLPAASITWSTSGSGAFSNPSDANAIYTPSLTDITAGSVLLTITTNNPSGPCPAVNDAMVLTISPAAIANAGQDASICQGDSYTLSGSIGGSASSLNWTTAGSGTFNNPNSATATYTPSASDIAAGSVTLTMSTDNPVGICSVVTDNMTITFAPNDNASFAYSASTFCHNGADVSPTITGLSGGMFSYAPNGLSLNASSGTINLSGSNLGTYQVYYTTVGPCPHSDSMQITITNSPASTFNFTPSAYCQFATSNPLPTFTNGGTAGVFTSSPAGLVFVSAITGEIDLTASSPGTYTITNTIAAGNGCNQSISTSTVIIQSAALATAGTDASICSGTAYTLFGVVSGGAASLLWTTNGTGSFNNPTIPNATYTPSASDIASGLVTITLNATEPSGQCPGNDALVLTINPAAIVNANTDAVICSGTNYTLSGSFGGGATSASWSSSGTGSFDNTSINNATYTPSLADISAGNVTLTYTTNNPLGSCNEEADAMVLTITPTAIANANIDDVICAGNTYTLSGSVAGSATSGTWTSSGTGTFNNPSLLNAIYSPSVADIAAGGVTLTLISNDPSGPCSSANDVMLLSITPNATANAGSDATICGNATYSLSGSYSGGATAIAWTTTGSGSFSSTTTPNAIYTPSASDNAAGSVNLIITTNDPPGICMPIADTMLLTISQPQDASFTYPASTFCISGINPVPFITGVTGGTFFSTPSGLSMNSSTGVVNLSSSATGTYVITYATTGPCPNTSTQTITLSSAPSATFNYTPATYCQNSIVNAFPTFPLGSSAGTFSATPVGISFVSIGTGEVDLTSSSPGIYTVTNTIPASGGCSTSSATSTITIGAQALVTAGADGAICAGSSFTLSGAIGGSATVSNWVTSGTGTFNNNSVPTATYTPSVADIANGSVTLTITTDDPAGSCPSATDAMQILISPVATVNAGSDASICAGLPYTLTGSIGGSANSSTWSTSGTGTFNNSTLLNANYTPSPADIASGSVTLTLTTNDPIGPCSQVNDFMVLSISTPASAFAGVDTTVCSGTSINLSGNIGGSASSLTWTTSGSGTFGNSSIANTSYTPSAADAASGSVTLTITTNDPIGACNLATDNLVMNINQFNDASFAYPSSTFCISGTNPTPTINGPTAGVFTFTPIGLSINSSTGTINLASSSVGTYLITNHTAGPCSDSATASITITNSFNANFNYTSGLYCQNGSPNPTPSYIGTGSGGVFTFSPVGLVINSVSGEVDLIISTPGTYVVTNTIAASGGCSSAIDTGTITITPHDDASFAYTGTSFCKTGTNPIPTITGLAGGTFSVSPANLSINASTGEVYLSASNVGSYNITYTTAGNCPFSSTVPFTITAPPDASFMYASGGVFCINAFPNPTPIIPGVGGIFSATPSGLVINAATGQIDLAASTVGSYMVTDSIPAGGGCAAAITTNTVTINALDNASFSYAQANYCQGGTNPLPTITGVSGGTFSVVPTGMTIDANTGSINLAATIVSAYTIIYTTNGACTNSSSEVLNVMLPPVASAGASANINCTGLATLTGSGSSPATYSWAPLSSIVTGGNSLTPVVNSPGTYTLTLVDGTTGCIATDSVSVTNSSQVVASFTTTPDPAVGSVPLVVGFTNTSINATNYTWTFCNGCPQSNTGDTSFVFTTSGTYTVYLVASNGLCVDTVSMRVIVNDAYSVITPNVFSPNDDGVNDIFTVNTKGVASLSGSIYDRWGLKIYEWETLNGGWDGRTPGGVKVAEGTYFYIVNLLDDYGKEYTERGSIMLIR